MYGLSTISPPAEEPVALDVAKLHLRVDHDIEDTLLIGWLAAARGMSESYANRRWVEQGVRLTLGDWPCEEFSGIYECVPFPVQPISSVDVVQYYAVNETLTTLAEGTDWQSWLDHSPPLIAPAPRKVWPPVQPGKLAAVRIEFTAGYGDANDVPEEAKAAILMMLAYWYENRGDGMDPTMMNGLPQSLGMPPGAKRLLDSISTGAYL